MAALSSDLENSSLWRSTLAPRDGDGHSRERERLRIAFIRFRDHAMHLATEIRRDLSNLTVHDVTHLDGLWDIASIIVGEGYSLTPTEGFVLGGAILLHDLAMSVAATDGGYAAILSDVRWADIVTSQYRTTFERNPTAEEIRAPEPQIQARALFEILRQIHAENAEKLAFISYKTSDGSPIFLIEDTEVRQAFGQVMGRIAHSHWWSLSDVEKQFGRVIGPPPWCPINWTVDPLKVACALRTADAAHLDARRAPTFLKAITNLSSSSEAHWRFQEKLAKPYLRQDSLVFTSTHQFRLNDATAWWLCLETLRMVDRELRSVDAMFSDKGYSRFAARQVAGVDHPERLASYVQTDGWLPINATVHVTDLPQVIKSLGGEALYGRQPRVALRELIQNACDAVRARRMFENRPVDFGSVTISLTESSDHEHWLEVIDSGIGMSQRVLTEFLLDFGRSFWGSPQMQEEFPGLLASTFKSTGKYGVGFFSVFMIANHVQVFTRRSDAAAADTLVLEFSSGLQGRPILRHADRRERLLDGGSRVRLKLQTPPHAIGGILRDGNSTISLSELIQELAPAVDVDIFAASGDSTIKVITANDWKIIDGSELLARIDPLTDHEKIDEEELKKVRARAGSNLRLLQADDGTVFGRACITVGYAGMWSHRLDVGGTVCVGGLMACVLTGIAGVLIGEPVRASRDGARPIVTDKVLQRWAEEQADLIPNLWNEPDDQAACAQYVRMCGGNTRSLPIAKNKGSWLSAAQIKDVATQLSTVVVMSNFTIEYELKQLASLRLDDNVFVTHATGLPGLLQASSSKIRWPHDLDTAFVRSYGHNYASLGGAVVDSVAEAWGVSSSELIKETDLNDKKDVRIGVDGEREIHVRAIKIERPKGGSLAS